MPSDNDGSSMSHHTKKKRFEDDQLPPDVGQKPVQLQRRRVWRACESCRSVPFMSLILRSSPTRLTPIHPQSQEDQVRWLRANLLPMCHVGIAMYLVTDQG